ncbi:sensor histidine kinase [Roseateles sp.]|uniref:sensor histidine kinase n=1 Tax=Roseateles sp. TaxID=1971397 RepID=UPI0025D69189|nr:histidine kinase [Roseateles sp.]MBV8037022.1 histidine kinase [Roseateles sp.]
MHPLLNHLRGLAAYLLAWVLAGLALAALLQALGIAPLGWALPWTVPLCGVLAFVLLAVYYPCRSRPFGSVGWAAALGYRAGLVLTLAAVMTALAAGWDAAGGLFGHPEGWVGLGRRGVALLGAGLLALLALSVLAHDVLIAFQGAQAASEREAQARLLARDMELQLLRLQIDPHFLFNSLNSISALTHLDPAAARAMAIDLAQFFRRTLDLAGRERIRLEDELGLVSHYLAIEQQRLGDKLTTAVDAEPASLDALLPPLTLQPLVENALKHGLRPRDDGGLLRVQALAHDGWLHLAVRNPVPATPSKETGLGLGLRNLRERLAAQYHGRARMQWGATPEGFAVEISLPYEASP